MTPLHWAVEKEHLEIVEFLIGNNADISCENKVVFLMYSIIVLC